MNDEVTEEATEATETAEAPEQTENKAPWADNWREAIAGDDEKELNQLGRYASPKDIWTKARALEQKLSSGEFKSNAPYPAEGTDDQKAAWRKDNGVPEAPTGYELAQDVDEADQEVINEFKQFSFDRGATPTEVQRAVDWFYHHQEQDSAALKEADDQAKALAEDELRSEWGDDYRAHMNRVDNFLETAPEGVKDLLWEARLPNGKLLKDTPDVLRFFIDNALALNPATTLVPGAGDNIKGAISDELKTFEDMMANKNSEYWKGARADDNQKRYRELLAAQAKMK